MSKQPSPTVLTASTPDWQAKLGLAMRERLGPVEAERMARFFLKHPEKAITAYARLANATPGDATLSLDELIASFREGMKAGDA